MIDKLDLRIPRKADFTPSFKRLYGELQAMERGPFRTAKHYEYAGDLREYGYNLRLNLYCRMDKAGNHKLELIDVGTMTKSEIFHEIVRVFEIDPLTLGIMRIDFAVDVPGIPLQWFRDAVMANHKRFRAAVTGQPFYSEMGNGDIQTLYFGKRPNVIRIYDKRAEYDAQYKTGVRKLGKDIDPPSFESMFGFTYPDTSLTRVERQIGGRMPEEIETLGSVCAKGFDFKPFSNLKIIDHQTLPERDPNVSFETHCTGLLLHSIARNDGMQAVKTFISRHSKGNTAWAWNKYAPFLPSASGGNGLTNPELQTRFAESLARQMA